MLSVVNRLTSVLKVISVQFILKDYRFLLFDLNVSNNSIMGVLGDVISVGPNGPLVDESSMRLLGDVITEGPDGPSLGTSLVVISYIHYICNLLVHVWECG